MSSCNLDLLELVEQETIVVLQPESLTVETDAPEQSLTDEAEPEVLTDTTQDQLVIEQEVPVVLLETGEQGPPGPAGPAGPSGNPYVEFLAGMPLGGHRAVRLLGGVAVYASSTSLVDANVVLGITRGAVAAGDAAQIQFMGLMDEPSWAWTPDTPVFCGENGLLTQAIPAVGFSLVVGIATSPTQIFIGAKMPIVL